MSLCTLHFRSIFQYSLRRIHTLFIPDAYLNPLVIENNIRLLDDQIFIYQSLNRHDKLNFEFNRFLLQASANFIWMSISAMFVLSLETLIYPTPLPSHNQARIYSYQIFPCSYCLVLNLCHVHFCLIVNLASKCF